MKKLNKKGFTIVELVIVIAVIAILAAVLIPTFSGVVDKAKDSAALQEVKNAYTSTMADDLVDKTEFVYGKSPIYVSHDDIIISIIDGKTAVVEDVDDIPDDTVYYRVTDEGTLRPISNNNNG